MKKDQILSLLHTPLSELAEQASEVLRENKGSHVYVRGLIEFSNICTRNCLYCGLRKQNHKLARYIMSQEEIVRLAQQARAYGVDTIVLQSGENSCDAVWLKEVVEEVVRILPVTLSVGEAKKEDYQLWAKAGASRYLLKHETADPGLYARLHPGYSLTDRLAALAMLKDLGYETGSGFMIGLPGQTLESLVDDIALTERMHVDMIGVGPFIPQENTPLGTVPRGSADVTLAVIAALRLAIPAANIPATTALATVDPLLGQIKGLQSGANVLMPGLTPEKYAVDYQIYDSKNRVSLEAAISAIEKSERTHALKKAESRES